MSLRFGECGITVVQYCNYRRQINNINNNEGVDDRTRYRTNLSVDFAILLQLGETPRTVSCHGMSAQPAGPCAHQPSVNFARASAVEREPILERGDLCIADVEVRLRLL